MEPNKEANKPRISYRYYELPEGELVQAITGEDWVCTYGTYAEDMITPCVTAALSPRF